jgi:hypothetical protein
MVGDPLEGADLIAHWDWVYDIDDDFGGGFSMGQFLLRRDGVLLRRFGGSSTGREGTTWRYSPWEVVADWPGAANAQEAMSQLKESGYDLCRPNIPFHLDEAGPFPGAPAPAEYL